MSALDNVIGLQEQICYVQCGLCTTILLVNVPCSSLSKVVTVKCGHCNIILSVNMKKACLVPLHFFSSLNEHQEETAQSKCGVGSEEVVEEKAAANIRCLSSDKEDVDDDGDSIHFKEIIHKPPQKKHRPPSAYNRFIKEEIKRLKIECPNMTHKQVFSAASKNWAHFPQGQYKGGEADGNTYCGDHY